VISQIGRLGGLFFVLQIVGAVASSADNFIIARMLGAVNVPEYSIPQRMFALIVMMSGMLVAPLWPAYGEAISRGHIHWVRHSLRKTLLIVLGATSAASFVLLLLSRSLIHWWVGSRIHPPFLLLLGMAVWTVLNCCGDAIAVFLNGAAIIRFQVIVASIFAVVCMTTKILFIRHFGASGIPWAAVMAYLLIAAIPYFLYIPRLLDRLEVHPDILADDPSALLTATQP